MTDGAFSPDLYQEKGIASARRSWVIKGYVEGKGGQNGTTRITITLDSHSSLLVSSGGLGTSEKEIQDNDGEVYCVVVLLPLR